MCVWALFKARECVWKREKRDDCTHASLIFFPTYRHAGGDWTSLTDRLASPHTCPHGSFILSDRSEAAQPLHPRSQEQSQCCVLTHFHALQMQTHDFAYSFACLDQITNLKSDCLFIYACKFLLDFTVAGLLILRAAHKGGLFWLLAFIRGVVRWAHRDPGVTIPIRISGISQNRPSFFWFFFLLRGFRQMSVVAHQNSMFRNTFTFSLQICVNKGFHVIYEFTSSDQKWKTCLSCAPVIIH